MVLYIYIRAFHCIQVPSHFIWVSKGPVSGCCSGFVAFYSGSNLALDSLCCLERPGQLRVGLPLYRAPFDPDCRRFLCQVLHWDGETGMVSSSQLYPLFGTLPGVCHHHWRHHQKTLYACTILYSSKLLESKRFLSLENIQHSFEARPLTRVTAACSADSPRDFRYDPLHSPAMSRMVQQQARTWIQHRSRVPNTFYSIQNVFGAWGRIVEHRLPNAMIATFTHCSHDITRQPLFSTNAIK